VLAEDVAKRMMAQTHESLVRPASNVLGIFKEAGPVVHHQTTAALVAKVLTAAALPDQSRSDGGPFRIPAVDGDFFLTLDFGVQTSGCLVAEIESTAERVLDVGYADCLTNGRVDARAQQHSLAEG